MEEIVVLLVSDLVTNAARRARGSFSIALDFQAERTWLRVEVRDSDPRTDVVILDVELGERTIADEKSELTAADQRTVVNPRHEDPLVIPAVVNACAFGTKDQGSDHHHLVEAVIAVAEDREYVMRSAAGAMLADRRSVQTALSAQERRALLLWFQGMSKASVARRMSITENTVRQYIHRARMKYATAGRPAPSKDALLARAIEDGIIRPGEVALYTSYAAQQPPVVHRGLTQAAPPGRRAVQPATGAHDTRTGVMR